MEYNNRLNELMFDNNININQLSSATGIKVRSLYRYLNNERIPCLKYCILLSDYFKSSINYILGISNNDSYTNEYRNKTFCQTYEELLKNKGINNSTVYNDIHISKSQYYDWKNGTVPKIETLIALAEYFNVTVDYLIGKEY